MTLPRVAPPLVLIVALAAMLAAVPAGGAATARSALVPWCGGTQEVGANRVPDLQASPNVVRVLYAIPADAPDNFATAAPLIVTDLAAADAWWQGQDPARTLRFDLYPFSGCAPGLDQLDLGFVRLPQPGSAYLDGSGRLSALGADLGSLVTNQQKTLVYYDGPVTDKDICGTTSFLAPSSGGRFGFTYVWLQACSADLGAAAYTAETAVHELVHGLGAVPDQAPHECPGDNAGHVCGDNSDLMQPFVHPLTGAVLDVGRDDYYGHSGTWWDVRNSSWLEHLPQRPLTVAATGRPGTVVTSPRGGLSCPPTCTSLADDGATVIVSTAPGPGSRFVSWSGDCTGKGTCSVTMDAAKSVTALFGPASFRVVVNVTGRGRVVGAGVSCTARCTGTVAGEATVRLRATPAKSYRFAGWGGDCSGVGACTVRGDAAHAVTARFRLAP